MKRLTELLLPRGKARALRPERRLAVERLVRHEVGLHRLLAASRRAASTHMSALRRAQPAIAGAGPGGAGRRTRIFKPGC